MCLLSSLCLFALAGSTLLADEVEPRQENPVQYKLEFKVYELNSEGEEKILTRPTVLTLEGQSASVVVGGEVAIPPAREGGVVEHLPFGLGMHTKIHALKPGRVRLHLTVENSEVERSGKQGVRLTGKMFRCIETVRFGKTTELLVAEDADGTETWVQVTINVHDAKLSEAKNEFGPPMLSRIPYVNRLFVKKHGRSTIGE